MGDDQKYGVHLYKGSPLQWLAAHAEQQRFLDNMAPAISPWRYTALDRWKWEQGIARIREGERRMKEEREKQANASVTARAAA